MTRPSGIPDYPRFTAIEPAHRSAFRACFEGLCPELAEFCFGNLYLFRKAHGYRVSRWRDSLLVLARGYDGSAYALPPLGGGDFGEGCRLLGAHLADAGLEPCLFPVPPAWIEGQREAAQWRWEADRDQADYVYLRQELAELPGRKFHKRKNRLNKFVRELDGEYRYEPLGAEHVARCRELAAGWCDIRCSPERPATYLETEAADEALRMHEALGLRGGVILVGDEVLAFCLGEELNPDTFVVHFEKARPGAEGVAQLINRDFCRHALHSFRFVNREQDLGDPGLRQAKEAYHPVHLTQKLRLWPR